MTEAKDAMTTEKEYTPEYKTITLTTLGALGLGNPDGIPSELADSPEQERQDYAEKLIERLVMPEDISALACIDGRETLGQADGSPAKTRLRRAGGTEATVGIALNGGSPLIQNPDRPLGDQIESIDAYVEGVTGYGISAHLGGCGAANGEISDQIAIATNPAIMQAAETMLSIPEVATYLEATYVPEDALFVKVQAAKTARYFEQEGWDGEQYVKGALDENPHGVEDLAVDDADQTFHGHAEKAVVIILGEEALPVAETNVFVWNLKPSKEIALALAEAGGQQVYNRLILAELAKHLAVCDRLPRPDTPVIVIAG